jgi:hypothetical protein
MEGCAMTKAMSSIRYSKWTLLQLTRLEEATGLKHSEIVTMAIDRMYWQQFGVVGEFHSTPAEFYGAADAPATK